MDTSVLHNDCSSLCPPPKSSVVGDMTLLCSKTLHDLVDTWGRYVYLGMLEPPHTPHPIGCPLLPDHPSRYKTETAATRKSSWRASLAYTNIDAAHESTHPARPHVSETALCSLCPRNTKRRRLSAICRLPLSIVAKGRNLPLTYGASQADLKNVILSGTISPLLQRVIAAIENAHWR